MHWVPHQHMPEFELLGFISPISMAIFQLLEPDDVIRPHWLPPIDCSVGHELTEVFEHGLFLGCPFRLKNRQLS